jgi:hypothetical protein
VAADTVVVGTEGGREFSRAIIGDELEMDVALAETDIVETGADMVAQHPEVGAILLECTNMVPYARALRARVGLPVYSIYSFVTWFQAGLAPRGFDRHDR